ncbi:UNVERIFIED_CONTAM: Protein RADIALIS-like 3, partial [Sesamum indicum]
MFNLDGPNHWQSVDSAAAVWSQQEDKILEQALVEFPEGIDHRWRRIAEFLPGKSPDEVRLHYEALLHDIVEIDSGRVELPGYSDESAPLGWDEARPRAPGQISFGGGNRSRHSEVERKKGTPWTEDEHRFDGLLHLHH